MGTLPFFFLGAFLYPASTIFYKSFEVAHTEHIQYY